MREQAGQSATAAAGLRAALGHTKRRPSDRQVA